MKSVLLGVCIITVCLVLISTSSAKIDPKTAAGVWLFDENKGKLANDLTDNANNGTFGGEPKWVKGKFDSALSFNGTSDFITIPDSDTLDLKAAWTITAWAFVNKAETSYGHIVGKRGAVANYAFRVNQAGTGWESYFMKGGNWMGLWGVGAVKKDEWHYMTAVYDGKSTITIYEDAIQIGTGGVGPPPPADDNTVRIASGWQGDNSELLNGILDEVAIFGVALTVDQIEALMNDGIKKAFNLMPVEPVDKLATSWGKVKNSR
jgi:hypothetical protein